VFDSAPSVTNLLTPANNADLVSLLTAFTWSAAAQAGDYVLEIDDNADFSSIELSTTLSNTNFTLSSPLNTSTIYFWRVRTVNGCSNSQSAVFSFITEPAPGDCSIVATPVSLFEDDVESGINGWTSSGTQDTWTINGDNPFSGVSSWHAQNPTSVSDQRLVSPAILLPTGQSPLSLQYQNHQTIEDSITGCWDGSILEISTDNGANWSYITGDKMLTDPYDDTFRNSTNPLSNQGLEGWCGDPQDWTRSVVDLDDYAGQTVQFRFRLGSDASIGRTAGWKIDDIKVQSCLKPDLIFMNGFE